MTSPTNEQPERRLHLPRRMFLTATAAGGVSLMLPKHEAQAVIDPPPGSHGPVGDEGVVAPPPELELVRPGEIWDQRTYYEVNGNAVAFSYNATFYGQLEAWLSWLWRNTPLAWGLPFEIYSYGAYVDKPGYHGSGRAFDLARIVATNESGGRWQAFLGRTDKWPPEGDDYRVRYRRRYWGVSASLHRHFRNVLTYRWDSAHVNHIHIDNQYYGTGTTSVFNTSSEAQVQHVQAICYFLWGRGTPVNGRWDSRTDRDSRWVLDQLGRSGGLTTQANWWAFNSESAKRGFIIGA